MIINPDETVFIILPLSNPRQYKRRYFLYDNFLNRLLNDYNNIYIITVEMVFNNHQPHARSKKEQKETNVCTKEPECTKKPEPICTKKPQHAPCEKENYKVIHVHSDSEVWTKESMINIGINELTLDICPGWKYLATIDTDIMFIDDDKSLINKTLFALSHHPVVQLWSGCVFLGPENEILEVFTSYGYQYFHESDIFLDKVRNDRYLDKYYHPGFAYAYTREFLDLSGGLIDYSICGNADYQMVNAICNKVEKTFYSKMNDAYKNLLLQWQENIKKFHYRLGYVNISIAHFWHGSRRNRRYSERNCILVKCDYNPLTDIKRNAYGLVVLNNNKILLLKLLQHYFKNRNEDSIDL